MPQHDSRDTGGTSANIDNGGCRAARQNRDDPHQHKNGVHGKRGRKRRLETQARVLRCGGADPSSPAP